MHTKDVFPKLVKEARARVKLTQKEFGKLFNPSVSQQAVTSWERGLAAPDTTYWPKLAELLGMSVPMFEEYVGVIKGETEALISDIVVKIESLGAKEIQAIAEVVAQHRSRIDDSNAANPSHLRILKKGFATWNRWREENPDIKPNLKGVDLNAIDCTDLSEYDLSSVDFSNIKSYATCFEKANLHGAILSGANLQRVNFQSCDMFGCNLSGATVKNSYIIRANLDGANLSSAVFTDSNLSKSSLRSANLKNVKLTYVDLSDCNLKLACLDGAELVNCSLGDVFLRGIDISKINKAVNIDTSTPDIDYIPKDDLAWALFCSLRRQQASLFEPAILTKLIEQEQQVIEIATKLVEKYKDESKEKSFHYLQQYNSTYYKIYKNDNLLEVRATNPDRNAIILRVSGSFIDSNIMPDDVENLKALLDKEEGIDNKSKAMSKATKKPS